MEFKLDSINEERLQKFIASSGVTSRRKAEELINLGKVKVNGKIVTKLGTKINPDKDIIECNGKIIKQIKNKTYILLNKPLGYVTTVKEQFNRDKVTDLIDIDERVVPAGRLDMYTSGALILSNDGEFINKITHPKNEISKTYNVTVKGNITDDELEKLRNGVTIDVENEKYTTKPAKVKILKIDKDNNISRLQITINEGKNREIRKMCEAINKRVLALHRAKIGNIDVKDLKLGSWRYLKKSEIEDLLK